MKRHAAWSALDAGTSAGFSVITSLIIARIIGPAELGTATAATAVHVLLWVVVNGQFADALVQRKSVNERLLSSAFWVATAAGCAAVLPQVSAGWALARMLDDPRLVWMSLLLAVPLPFVGAAGVIQGMLTRERAYRGLALRTVIGQGLGSVVGIMAAVAGAGGWALIWQQATSSLFGALALLLGRRWRPSPCLDWAAVRSLLGVGLPLTASTLVLAARYRLFAVIIGASAGPAVLGQVHLAFRLVDTVRDLAFTALWRLMLPALAAHQHDPAAMLVQVDRWLRWSVGAMFPLCGVLALLLTQIVTMGMGPDWTAAGQAAVPLVGLMALSTLMFPSGVALVAVGRARLALYGNLAAMVVGSTAAMLMRPTDPWHAVMVWTVSQLLVCPYAMAVNARALRVRLIRPLSGGLRFRLAV